MPKIKDLGIKVVPETMKPPEVGGGGGCTDCTVQAFSICGGTRGCTDCTQQAFSICGGTQQQTCSDCTFQAFSICGGTQQGCTDCTFQAFSICGGTGCRLGTLGGCTDCTVQPFSICGGTGCGFRSFCACTNRPTFFCGPISAGCGAISRICAGSIDPTIVQQPDITREQIAALKDSLRKQITALEEHEKSLGPKTVEEIDAREKALNEELAQLKARRKDLK